MCSKISIGEVISDNAYSSQQLQKDIKIDDKISAGIYRDPGDDTLKKILIAATAGLLVYAIATS